MANIRFKAAFLLSIIATLGMQNTHAIPLSDIISDIAIDIIAIQLPDIKLPDISTRSVFARCLVKSIWDTIWGKKELDRDWQAIYRTNNPAIQNAEQSAQNLQKIIGDQGTFKFGLSSSAYQFEGGVGDECATTRFYKDPTTQFYKDRKDKGEKIATPDKACDFWNNYETMIKEMAEQAHIKMFRLETLWSRIQPNGPDTFDFEAIQHYKKIVKTLKKYNIEPLIVFHHYTIPTWFANQGGFEKEENIEYFVNFCLKVYEALLQDVTYWSTFNAVEGYAFKGYYTGDGAPGIKAGIKGDMQKTADVMKNMLEAHVQVYQTINNSYQAYLPQYREFSQIDIDIPKPQIGIQKNILQLDPASKGWKQKLLSPASRIVCGIGNMFQNEGFYNFFTTGVYSVYIPTKVFVVHKNSNAPNCLDWVGVNTYSNQGMCLSTRVKEEDPEKQTLNPNYRFYPEGIYRAVQEVAERVAKPIGEKKGIGSIPIWITENGIPTRYDNEGDNEKRTRFFQQSLHTITLAAKKYRIEAYLPWASHDNYEWGAKEGFGTKPYGFFYVNPKNPSGPHRLKKGSPFFISVSHRYHVLLLQLPSTS